MIVDTAVTTSTHEHGRLVQIGAPEEIYASPATPFVARFTGLAAELPVRVRGSGPGDTIEVEPTEHRLARPLHARSALAGSSDVAALLTIRPTAVQIWAPDGDEHHLLGTVTDVAFRDRGYEHAVDLPGDTRISAVFAPRRVQRGGDRRLCFEPSGCLVFPAPAKS